MQPGVIPAWENNKKGPRHFCPGLFNNCGAIPIVLLELHLLAIFHVQGVQTVWSRFKSCSFQCHSQAAYRVYLLMGAKLETQAFF